MENIKREMPKGSEYLNDPTEDPTVLRDVIEWDVINWSHSLSFWREAIDPRQKGFSCLELGSRRGGLSLWMALMGNEVICSDVEPPGEEASSLHRKYEVSGSIHHETLDVLDLPYENAFDVILFKSVLGGVSRGGKDANKKEALDQIRKALKPGGILLFSENLEASKLHRFLRRRFVSWGNDWNYLRYDEVEGLLEDFSEASYRTHGFLGVFGRNEGQRRFLGKLDRVVQKLVLPSWRYVLTAWAKK
jgi:SAM-dependent methyltransferase